MYTLQQWEQKISSNLQRSTGLNSEIRWLVHLPCILEFHSYPFLKLWNLSFDFFLKCLSPERMLLQSNLKWHMRDNIFRPKCLIIWTNCSSKIDNKHNYLHLNGKLFTSTQLDCHIIEAHPNATFIIILSFLILFMRIRIYTYMIFNFWK